MFGQCYYQCEIFGQDQVVLCFFVGQWFGMVQLFFGQCVGSLNYCIVVEQVEYVLCVGFFIGWDCVVMYGFVGLLCVFDLCYLMCGQCGCQFFGQFFVWMGGKDFICVLILQQCFGYDLCEIVLIFVLVLQQLFGVG